jgi:dTDP-4-amino-4,6-dideoxygalactose transaminase
MVATRDGTVADRCRVMRLHGISRDAFERYTSKKPSWYYEVVAPGYKYNMMDLAASLGIHQLKKAWKFRQRREEIAGIYDEAFKNLPLVLPPRPLPGDLHAWHLYVIRLTDEARVGRDRFIERMMEMGIACSVHFIPLHFHPYWKDRYRLKPDDFPEATRAFGKVVSLPLYTKMSGTDQERVITAVRKILG